MIYYLSTERYSTTIRHFVRNLRPETRGLISSLTYEELFFECAGPAGHYIFTDFDRLTRYELECAAAFALALTRTLPEARILNHPLKVLERYPLLITLHREGLNRFTATRLESGDLPPDYPVFIRAEDGYGGPETDLLSDKVEYEAALEALSDRQLPKRGRIAIGFANERSPDGYFHKYGAFNIAGMIIPHDRLYGRNWAVKFYPSADGFTSQDEEYGKSDVGVAQELEYVKANPHREVLLRAFSIAGIEFGRADYGVVNGRVQIYEINTNPHLPYGSRDTRRAERRVIIKAGIFEALNKINVPIGTSSRVYFKEPRPRAHNLHWPRQRLPISLVRRGINRLVRRASGNSAR